MKESYNNAIMVLNDLGSKCERLSSLSKHTVIDEEIMEDVLKVQKLYCPQT